MAITSWGEEKVDLLARISAQEEHVRFVQVPPLMILKDAAMRVICNAPCHKAKTQMLTD